MLPGAGMVVQDISLWNDPQQALRNPHHVMTSRHYCWQSCLTLDQEHALHYCFKNRKISVIH